MKTNKQVENYYDEKYFHSYQREIGEFGGMANLFKFQKAIRSEDTVLDFGCGGGFLLNNIDCNEKIGVDLNPIAREYCQNVNKITCHESIESVPDNSIDIIISNNCLEHAVNPYEIFTQMHRKLKINGRIVIVLPCDSHKTLWKANDIDNHLYSFSPMNLGNLLQAAGFHGIKTKPLFHKWPPFYKKIYSIFGKNSFHLASRIYGRLNKTYVQVWGEAVKK